MTGAETREGRAFRQAGSREGGPRSESAPIREAPEVVGAPLHFLVLQHISCEPPAAYEDELVDRGMTLERIEIDEGDALPDWRGFDGLIAMGGPMGVNDEDAHPWLRAEKRLIAEAVRAGKPYWGICLGGQLLAAALGARVFRGTAPEVGMYEDLTLTEGAAGDPVFSAAPQRLVSLQWHSDGFELPDGAVLLVSSPTYRHQAFSWKGAYGLQFHLEVPAELAAQWAEVPAYASALEQILGAGAMTRLVDAIGEHSAETTALARRLFGRWLDLVVSDSVAIGGEAASAADKTDLR